MRSVGGKLGVSLVLIALLLPVAAAADGRVQTEGGLSIPGPSAASYQATALFLPDASGVSALDIVGSARFCHDEQDLQDVQVWPVDAPITRKFENSTEGCFDTPALKVSLVDGSQSGWIGGRFHGPSPLNVSMKGSLSVEPSADTLMTSPDAADDTTAGKMHERSDEPTFFERTVGPHVSATETGAFRYHGKGEVKLRGPAIRVETPTNLTDYQTGDSARSDPLHPVHQTTWRWVTIDFDGDLVLESLQPARIQATEAAVAWDGVAHFVAASGTLDMDGASYAFPPGVPASVEGRLVATLMPADARGEGFDLAMHGDVRSATVGGFHVASASNASRVPWPLVAGLAVASVVVLGGAATATRRHARPRRLVEARRLAEEASRLLEREGRERDALALYRASLRLAPTGSACLAVALILRRRGETRGALHYFARAAKSCAGGSAESGALLCALDIGDLPVAQAWAIAALLREDLEPVILSALAVEPRFAPLRKREAVRLALEAATERQALRGWPSLV